MGGWGALEAGPFSSGTTPSADIRIGTSRAPLPTNGGTDSRSHIPSGTLYTTVLQPAVRPDGPTMPVNLI